MNSNRFAHLVRAALCPEIAVRQIIRRLSIGSVEFRLALQALDRPQYAFGMRQAIVLASKLKYPRVSVIEFGVAQGAGLLALERYAADFGRRSGVGVEVIGFDSGYGLPSPLDYRDLGYAWKREAYKMDVEALKRRLKSARLILGDVRETVPEFLNTKHAPIGFISFDLDYYSSTIAAFQIFASHDKDMLPRVLCYFDDVISNGYQLHCNQVGELRAIREFSQTGNDIHTLAPFGPMGAGTGLLFPALWMQQVWVYHRFQHADYNTYIGAA